MRLAIARPRCDETSMASLAVVTGASAGIGRATAVALAEAGLEVLAVARRAADVAAAAPRARVQALSADVTSAAGIAAIRAAVAGRPVAALVHGAGVFPRAPIAQLTPADWQAAMATNVQARLALVLALEGPLAGGRVLFVGSDAARAPRPGGAAYSVSQAAAEMLWRCLQAELGEAIAFALAKPGLVATAMLDASLGAPRERFPAGAVYAGMLARGETIAAATVARFFRFLLLAVARAEFAAAIWDIRDAAHHRRWLRGPLYLPPDD